MVDEVVVVGLGVRRRGEVDAVRFACRFERRVGASETDEPGVEFTDVARDLGGAVPSGVDGDEDRLDYGAVFLVCEKHGPRGWLGAVHERKEGRGKGA